jgi:hypothetical protein
LQIFVSQKLDGAIEVVAANLDSGEGH